MRKLKQLALSAFYTVFWGSMWLWPLYYFDREIASDLWVLYVSYYVMLGVVSIISIREYINERKN